MKPIVDVGLYLWRFFVGDSFQLLALVGSFVVVGLLAPVLHAWDGVLAFLLVAVIVWIDVLRRARPAKA